MIKLIAVNGDCIYGLSETTIRTEEFGMTKMYGIMIKDKDSVACVKDISYSFGFVHELFNMIVEEELYPQHLTEVVEDYLSFTRKKIIPIEAVRERLCQV